MTPNQIESAKERINFLTRLVMAYIAGVYLLAGVVGKHLMEWLAHDELVWSEFGLVPTVAAVFLFVMAAEIARLLHKIRRNIHQIGVTP